MPGYTPVDVTRRKALLPLSAPRDADVAWYTFPGSGSSPAIDDSRRAPLSVMRKRPASG